MPDKNGSSLGGSSSSGGNSSEKRKRNRGGGAKRDDSSKNSESNKNNGHSKSSSSGNTSGNASGNNNTDATKTSSFPQNGSKISAEPAAKITIKKREQPPPPSPLIACVLPAPPSIKPLMATPVPYGYHLDRHKVTPSSSGRVGDVNNQQRNAYYFSANAGSAVSAEVIKTPQYTKDNFPLEKNVNILVDKHFSLMISPTTSRCNGLYIRVKSPNSDDFSACALLKLESDDKAIRKACKETMDNYIQVSAKKSSDRSPFSPCSEAYLKANSIRRLDDRQDAFPEAIYYCEMCDYHINTINHAKSHLESSSHFDDLNRKQQREHLLKSISPPRSAHQKSINRVLKEVLEEYKQVQQKEGEIASSVLYYLKTTVFPSLGCPDVTLRPFGSYTYDVVLPDSDYNVAYTLDLPEGTPIFSFLEKVRSKIAGDGHPANHSMEMGTPSTIIFNYEGVRVRLCWMSCFNYRSQLHLSSLMKTYVELREEVVQFLQLIRLWASKAGVDSKNRPRIGLPRYGFDLMAIHFLQKHGYLPILHELYERNGDAPDVNKTGKNHPDDESEKIQEAGRTRIRNMSCYERDIAKIKSKFKNFDRNWNMAELFVKFFRYYVEQHRDIVIQITQSEPMSRDEKRWNKKVLHVVDPFRGDNVLSIPKVSTWQPYYFNCLLTTFLSFAIPRTVHGPIVEVTLIHNKTTSLKKKGKEPHTPKPVAVPAKATIVANITDEQYNQAADARAEEQENEQFMKQMLSRTVIDGIKYAARKPENYDIDDHRNAVYGRRALLRFKRVIPCKINEKMAISIEDASSKSSELLTRKSKGWIKKWRKSQEENEEEGDVVEITEKMEQKLQIVDATPDERIEMKKETEPTLAPPDTENENATSPDAPTNTPTTNSESPTPPEVSVTVEQETSQVLLVVQDSEEISEIPKIVETPIEAPTTPEVPSGLTPEAPEAPASLGADSVRSDATLDDSLLVKEEPPIIQKQQKSVATFVNPKLAQMVVEKQICYEEFFIKDGVDFQAFDKTAKTLKTEDYRFEFTTESFCGGFEMEMKCTHCDGNHCVEKCPMMEIPPIEKFKARTPEDLKDIDDVIDRYYEKNIMNDGRMKQMESQKNQLEKYLRQNYDKNVTLTIFGSVMTGLSVNCSDIDICLRFGEDETPPPNKTPKQVIAETEVALRRCPLVRKLQAIVTAKVPIVKFQLRLATGESIDADISYYNVLAIHNTRLLKEYTFWTPDNRFAKLALFVKRWAKFCDIGDASRGSLSSYAHIILLISYLQNCDPPVLPRLQEDFRSTNNQEKRIIDNWDTSFAEVEESLQKTWPKNKESCAQLLIGYFNHYSHFDFRNFVVQCRREMILSKMEKDWPRPICVEDPFDLSHNLSSGVTKKMFVFIMKVFISSRAVFMSETPKVNRDVNFLMAYENQLLAKCNQGSAPTDRQCHNCHRIGHFFESCPQRAQGRDARRRFGSNSTSTSYRSNDGFNYRGGSDDSNDVLLTPGETQQLQQMMIPYQHYQTGSSFFQPSPFLYSFPSHFPITSRRYSSFYTPQQLSSSFL